MQGDRAVGRGRVARREETASLYRNVPHPKSNHGTDPELQQFHGSLGQSPAQCNSMDCFLASLLSVPAVIRCVSAPSRFQSPKPCPDRRLAGDRSIRRRTPILSTMAAVTGRATGASKSKKSPNIQVHYFPRSTTRGPIGPESVWNLPM